MMFCLQTLRTRCTVVPKAVVLNTVPTNNFWAWLTFIFNRVSKSRIEQVGPDRACAEWLMRNGALVRWKGQNQFLTHYDKLPKDEDSGKYRIQEVDATEASISHHGFPHFKNCNYVECIKFDRCSYLEDEALHQLVLVKSSLESLLIYRCGNLTDKGILSIANLLKLRTLEMGDLMEVRDMKKCIKLLQAALPNCNIKYMQPKLYDEVKSGNLLESYAAVKILPEQDGFISLNETLNGSLLDPIKMVLFTLCVKCNLEEIKTLYPSSDFTWIIKVKCSGCGEESPNWHTVDAQSSYEGKGGKGKFNFLYKCKFCNRENSLDILTASVKKITSDECMDFKPLVTFDCRGLQPVDFTPGKGWIAEAAESGKRFEEIDLTEKEWVEYDERSQQSVGIYEFESKFIHSK